ncbi:ENV1 protein, partial [Ibidorhyncha struthersii]|nr:ENV1 protein [Ibidorhyncha struthersii]
KIINASYRVLNQTSPNLTKHCWLCVSIKPPYYEAIGDLRKLIYSNESNPLQCNWRQEIGITLTQVSGKSRCV